MYDITTHGAVGDGKTNDTAAIQQAIDQCSREGGGTVYAPPGKTYIVAGLMLKSDVRLFIERGATILGSPELSDYDECVNYVIGSLDAESVEITGGGVIDGNGRAFVTGDKKYIYVMGFRPYTLKLVHSQKIRINGIIIKDGAHWTHVLESCDDVVIHGITIYNDLKLPNNDGIGLNHCRNVRISDCHIEAGDDGIVLKATPGTPYGGPCENITVTGCTLITTSCALMIGCEACEEIRNVVFDSCVIRSSNRGLAIHLSEEANVENVIFSNMTVETRYFHELWWGCAEPIYVVAIPYKNNGRIGKIRNVRFTNVLCKSENGVFVHGWEHSNVENVIFDNITVEIGKWSKWAGGLHDIRPCPDEYVSGHDSSGFAGLYKHDTAGFFIKNAKNITLRNCQVSWDTNKQDYFGELVETHNVEQLKLESVQ